MAILPLDAGVIMVTMVSRFVIFDLDGTLVDSRLDLATAVNRTLGDLGRSTLPDERIVSYVGHGIDRLLERALDDPESMDEARSLFERHYGDGLLERTRPYAGVDELVRRLADEVDIGVATNKPGPWARTIVDGLGWHDAIPFVVGGGDVARLKPAPDMAERLLELSGHLKCETLMVGDMEVDLEFARAAGLACVGVAWGLAGRERLRAANAMWTVDSAAELGNLLRRGLNPS